MSPVDSEVWVILSKTTPPLSPELSEGNVATSPVFDITLFGS